MRVYSPVFLKLFLVFLDIQYSSQQQYNCDSSCSTCSLNKISECTSCQESYHLLSQENKCFQNCPQGTYLDEDSDKCISCASKSCIECSKTICIKCNPGFINDPFNPNNCISNCSLSGQILNEQGQCDYGCQLDDLYDVNNSEKRCVNAQPCSIIKQTPELQNKSEIIQILYDDIQKSIFSIDTLGKVVIYSYPEQNILAGYSLKMDNKQIIDCMYLDDNSLQNQIITCLQSPLSFMQFYSNNGTVINETYINDRTFTKKLDSNKTSNIILAEKNKYELYLINFSTQTYAYVDSMDQAQISANQVQKEFQTFPFDIMIFNQTDGSLNYYLFSQSQYQKILSFFSGQIDQKSKMIQLTQFDYWVFYTDTSFQILKLNRDTFKMSLKKTYTIEEKINFIYLTSFKSELLFVIGNQNSLQLRLFELFDQKENFIFKEKEIFNSFLNNVNQIKIQQNIMIACSNQSINIYQLSYDNSYLEYLTILREDNNQICSISNFSVMKYDKSIHIWLYFKGNLKIHIYDIISKKYFQSLKVSFNNIDNLKKKFTNRENYFNLLVESYENQQLFEIKTYGFVFIYDIIKKNIINQVRIWYPEHEIENRVLFNFVQMKDNLYLFAGFERQTFKLKIINVKTFEISYEQEISEINFNNFSDLRAVQSPIYFNNSDSIIIPILRMQQSQDIQNKYDFIFVQSNQKNNKQARYTITSSIQQQAKDYIFSNSAEVLIVFILEDNINLIYNSTIYNIYGIQAYTVQRYIQKSSNTLGYVKESTKELYITSYSGIIVVSLNNLSIRNIKLQCLLTTAFNKNFTLLYVQDGCSPSKEGVYENGFDNIGVQKNLSQIKYSSYLNYNWNSNSQLVLSTSNTNLVLYNGANQYFYNFISIHGVNQGGLVQDSQVVFFNEFAISHYEFKAKPQLLLVQDVSIKQQYLLQTQQMRNNYILSDSLNIHQVKKFNQLLLKKITDTDNVLLMQYIADLNYIICLTINSIKIYDYNPIILLTTVSVTFAKINTSVNYFTQELFKRQIYYYQPSNVLIAVYNSTLACVNMTTLKLAFKVSYQNEFQAFKSTVIDYGLGYFISTNAVEDCILNLKTLVRKCYKELDSYQLVSPAIIPFKFYTLELFIDKKTKSLIICQATSIRIFSLLTFQYLKSYYNTLITLGQFFYNPNYNYIICTTNNYEFRLFDLSTITSIQLQITPIPLKDYQNVAYKLNSADSSSIQKLMLWDRYKQKLIIASNLQIYVIGISKKLIELYYADAFFTIISIQLINNKNILFFSSIYYGYLFDYDYFLNDNKETFPNQINPRYFSVNENMIFFINDVNSQINLFVNGIIRSSWHRNNLFFGYIRIVGNDLKNYLVFCIFDNEITILDISSQEIVQKNQVFHSQNIINVLYEDQFRVFLLSQSQQILSLIKNTNQIQINEIIKLPQGIAYYSFIKKSSQFIFIDYVSQLKLNIVNFVQNGDKLIGQQSNNPIVMTANITHFDVLNDTVVIILLETQLLLYNLDQMQIIKSITLPLSHLNGNIKVDNINQRVFIQNKQTGSLIFDFNLTQKTPQPQINTFSNSLQFDDNFIYSIVGHSANIFFRKDLQLLINFRNFNSSLTLKKIRYLGVGYFFLVEFISQISVYDFSPFNNLPIQIQFTQINQYTLINHKLIKLGNSNQKYYKIDLQGFNQEGMFMYSNQFDLYELYSKTCVWIYQIQFENYSKQSKINQLKQYLNSQSQKLNKIILNIQQKQNLFLPQISDDQIADSLQIIIKGEIEGNQVYVLYPLNSYNNLQNLKLQNMQISQNPILYERLMKNNQSLQPLDISKYKYPQLKLLLLENIQVSEVIIKIQEINQILIKNIKFMQNNQFFQSITQLDIKSADLIQIDIITIEKCDFKQIYPLIKFTRIAKVVINNFYISECQFYGLNSVFSFENIDYLQIDNFQISKSNLDQQIFFSISSTNSILVKLLSLENILFTKKLRRLQNSEEEQTSNILFDIMESEKLQIKDLQINSIESKFLKQLFLFKVNYIKNQLEINKSQIMNIKITEGHKAALLSLKGVYKCILDSFSLSNMKFIQFVDLQSYLISNSMYFLSDSLSISNTSIANYQIMKQSIIDVFSQSVKLNNFTLNNVELIQDISVNQLIIPVVQLNTKNLKIANSQFQIIQGFYYSIVVIRNSISLIINNSMFDLIITADFDSNFIDSQKQYSNNYIQENISIIHFQDCKNIILTGNSFTNNTNKIGSGGSIYSQNSQFYQVDLNLFELNQSLFGSGGAIHCNEGSFEIFNSNQFIQNQAIQGSGGAIFLNNCDINQFMNNFLSQNEAFVGGAIRYKKLKPLAFMNKSISLIKQQNKFSKNKSICYGKDIGSYPSILDVKNYFEDDKQNQRVQLIGVQSGQKAKNPISLRFIDEEMKEIMFVDLKSFPKLNNELIEELSLYTLQAESDSIGLLGELKSEYLQDEYAFKFDLTYSYKPKSTSTIKIKSAQNLFQFVPGSQKAVQKQYDIQINIQFRECQIGEVITQSGQFTICQICQQGFYSFIDPYSSNQVSCIRCPIGSTGCQGSQIDLENGYWRSNKQSDIIIRCSSTKICQSQDLNSKFGCIEGYQGPLCEECDVNGDVWGKHYGKFGDFDCRDCSQFSTSINIIIVIIIFLFISLQIYAKVYNKLKFTKKYILASYMVKLGMISPNIQLSQTLNTSLMKILLNYIQFLMIVNSLDITLPSYFTAYDASGGDPSKLTINVFDCLLFKYKLDMPVYIIRILSLNLQIIMIFFFIEILCQISIHKSSTYAVSETLYTNLIIIFCVFQPSMTKVLSQSFSCRLIGDQYYIISDLTQKCYGEEHIQQIYQVLFPLSLFWIAICPLFLYLRLRKYKNQMHTIKIMYRYGYLYQEYKPEHYYWDIVRILIRSFVIVTINVFNFRTIFKGLIIQGILTIYKALSKKYQPYYIKSFNQIDQKSCFLVIQTLNLLIVGYLSENILINLTISIFVGILNGRFLITMLIRILLKPIPQFENERKLYQKILFKLKQKFPYLFKWIKISMSDKMKSFKNWKKIRESCNRIRKDASLQRSQRSEYSNQLLILY